MGRQVQENKKNIIEFNRSIEDAAREARFLRQIEEARRKGWVLDERKPNMLSAAFLLASGMLITISAVYLLWR